MCVLHCDDLLLGLCVSILKCAVIRICCCFARPACTNICFAMAADRSCTCIPPGGAHRPALLQAEAEYNRNHTSVSNMHTVVRMCVKAVDERWRKYDELFESVSRTVSAKFMGYMHRRGHQVWQGLCAVTLVVSSLCPTAFRNSVAGADGPRSSMQQSAGQLPVAPS